MKVPIHEIGRKFSNLPRLHQKLVQISGLASVADWLFFGYWPGISAVIFILLLAAVLTGANFRRHEAVQNIVALVALIISVAPLVEELNLLSVLFALAGLATFSLWMTGSLISISQFSIWQPARLLLNSPFFLPNDLARVNRRYGSPKPELGRLAFDWRDWLVPVSASGVFVLLLIGANPVIEQFSRRIFTFDIDFELFVKTVLHVIVWFLAAAFSWGFLRRHKLSGYPDVAMNFDSLIPASEKILGISALTKSLFLFNLIFAIHTMSDALYLWAGAQLPAGLTYAQYAHRGTYSLLATAILAAVFVLLAISPRSSGFRSTLIRNLVYLWLSQTVVMILSAFYRLQLYVAHYSLTYARVYAFMVIALVGIGLVLIVAQIIQEKSSQWLINANITVLTLMLYCFSMANFDYLIAKYNVEHSYEVSGKGRPLDIVYINSLGAQALPPLIENFDQFQHKLKRRTGILLSIVKTGDRAVASQNWRGWGFRHWRLKNMLEQTPLSVNREIGKQ